MRPSWFKISAILAALWAVTGTVIWWIQRDRPTPERIVAFVEAHPLDGRPEAERAGIVGQVAARFNRLDYSQRQRMYAGRMLGAFANSLTSAERIQFFELIVPKGLSQFAAIYAKMEPGRQRKAVDRVTRDLRDSLEDTPIAGIIPFIARNVSEKGVLAYFQNASVEQKLEALPFIEALLEQVQWNR
jgi:hypothetical protein